MTVAGSGEGGCRCVDMVSRVSLREGDMSVK